ncbi:MAG TPA: L,D-transpeptidase [Gaiellaceae bacterium]|nr:L,D-transpeptidase [Gaiellaceae bacterium]
MGENPRLALDNVTLGWADARAAGMRLLRRPISLEVDLSRRELAVHDAEGIERRISVAIGAPETPTPADEFYVTDKLPASSSDSATTFGVQDAAGAALLMRQGAYLEVSIGDLSVS